MRQAWAAALAAALVTSALQGCALPTQDDSYAQNSAPQQEMPETIVYDRTGDDSTPSAPLDPTSFAGLLASGEVESIRVLGDSITAGYLIDGFDAASDTGIVVYDGGEGTYYETSTYVACWTNAFRSYATGIGVDTFVNAGVSGFRMLYLAEDPDAWLGDGADVIVVMLGTNDAAKESADDFRIWAEQALTAAEARCRHLVVVSPPANQRTDAMNLYGMDTIDAILTELCDAHGWEHVSLLDVLQVGTDDFFPDQVHPTQSGSEKLWEALRTRLSLP